jgi:hypothetical protein
MVWGKVEDFGEERTGGAVETKAEGLGPNLPGPSGLPAVGAHFVGLLGR